MTKYKEYEGKVKEFLSRLSMMKLEAFVLELYETGHAIDSATNKAGFESANKLIKKQQKSRGK